MSEDFVPGSVIYAIPGKLSEERQRGKYKGPGFLCVVKRTEQFDSFCGRFALTQENALLPKEFEPIGLTAGEFAWQVVLAAISMGFMSAEPIADCRSDEILVKFLV